MIGYGARPIETSPPNGAIWVDWERGSDRNRGTGPTDCLGTPHEAARQAGNGATIVLRGVRYPTEWATPWNKSLIIQAAPGESPMFDGADPVRDGWAPSGAGLWRKDGWTQVLSHDIGDWAIVDEARPWAPYPLQVLADGRPLQRVGSIAEVAGGRRFCHDEANGQLWIGIDPTAFPIEVTTRQRAIVMQNARMELHGITARRYATSPQQIAAISGGAAGSVFRDLTIVGCSAAGLFVNTTPDVTVEHCTLAHNGQFGGRAWRSERLRLAHCLIQGNNWKEFATGQAAGGWKSDTGCNWSVVHANRWLANIGHACWWDIQSNDLEVTLNDFDGHSRGVAVFFEISRRALIALNRWRGCVRGAYAAGSTDVDVWNNTEIDCGAHTAAVTDDRAMSLYGYEHRNYRIRNGNVSQSIEDPAVRMRVWHDGHGRSRRSWADVHWSSDFNRFHRRTTGCGRLAGVSMGLGVQRDFDRTIDLVQHTGQEVHSEEHTGASNPFMDADGRATGTAVGKGEEPPPRVRELIHRPTGPIDVGWYGPDPQPPEEPPMPTCEEDLATVREQLRVQSIEYWNTAVTLNTTRDALAAMTASYNYEVGVRTGLESDLMERDAMIEDLQGQLVTVTDALTECQGTNPPGEPPELIIGGSNKLGYPDLKARLTGVLPGCFRQFCGAARFTAADLDKMEAYVADGVIPVVSVQPGTQADTDYNMDQLRARGLDLKFGGYIVGHEPTQKPRPVAEWRAANIYAASVLPPAWELVVVGMRVDYTAAPEAARFIGNWIGPDTSWVGRLGVDTYDKHTSQGKTFEWLMTQPEAGVTGGSTVEAVAQAMGKKLWVTETACPESPDYARPAGWKPQWIRDMAAYAGAHLDVYELVSWFNSDVGPDTPPLGWWSWTHNDSLAAYREVVAASQD